MSKPSFSNIDLWLFEYAEGNLTPDQEAQLELFILQHPELDIDRDMWEMAKVAPVKETFPEQESLYRRKPVNRYVIAGSAALLLLLMFGYSWMSFDELNEMENGTSDSVVSGTLKQEAENQQLRDEVRDLKVLVASLEDQLNENRGAMIRSNNVQSTSLTGDSQESQDSQSSNPGQEINTPAANSTSDAGSNSSNQINVNQMIASNGNNANILTNSNGPANGQMNNFESTTVANNNVSDANNPIDTENLRSNDPGLLSSEFSKQLEPIGMDLMELPQERSSSDFDINKSAYNGQTIHTNYEKSYKYKLSKFMRDVRRMIDNPIALQNLRDPHYHIPGMITNDLNFGSTGNQFASRLQTVSRLQWYGRSNEMFSNQIAADSYLYGLRGGLGVQLNHQYYNNGGIQNSNLAITYSPKISVSRQLSIEPAIRFKMGNKTLNAGRMEGQTAVEMMAGNQIGYYTDGTTPVGRMLWYQDLGLGLNVNTEWFYGSVQVDNIFRHRDNMYSADLTNVRRAGAHFVATLGTDLESQRMKSETRKGDFGFSPYLVYQKFEDVNEMWAGANFRCYWLTLGGAVSTNLDPAASVGLKFKHFSFTYNADYMRSRMTGERSLSHQLTLRITGKPNRIGRF